MKRTLTLIRFELVKILGQKKALLFLLALNIIPLLTTLSLLFAYVKYKALAMGTLSYPMLFVAVKNLFVAHFKIFAWVSPFFMALIVGDSISTEFNKGHMKTLLLTPIKRWQIISAKTLAIMFFLIIALVVGGALIQSNLVIAKVLGKGSVQALADSSEPVSFITAGAATQLLLMSLVGTFALLGYFIFFALFFESAIIMSLVSIIVLMGVHSFYYIGTYLLLELDPWYGKAAEWCFTRHFDSILSFSNISDVLEGSKTMLSQDILAHFYPSLGWAAAFFGLAIWYFSKKQILR